MIVLDTHIWFWWVNGETGRFPIAWSDSIAQANCIGVSAVSCFEIALACRRGRMELGLPMHDWFADALHGSDVQLLPLTPAIASRAVGLAEIHRDPFDRIIIATALEYGAKLASIDGHFPNYPELEGVILAR